MDWYQSLEKPKYWLLALAVALATLHLTILDQANQPNLMSLSVLVWLTIASLIWDKKEDLKLNSGLFSSFFGATLIAFVMIRGVSPAGYHTLISPLISGLGLVLIASGIKGLHQYTKELAILTLLPLSNIFSLMLRAINLPTLTAMFSNSSLWATGFQSYRDGVFIVLPTGRVEVYGVCSGAETIMLMFFVSILFLFLVPLNRIQQLICVTVAVLLGFVINGIRVCIMTVLVAFDYPESFEYWHGDDGSLIFALISVLIFGAWSWFVYVRPLTLVSDLDQNIDQDLLDDFDSGYTSKS
ncbi:MAG TPA: cyanoexosortase A [Cyanothece sp. UBA12306]|nr:cyanoexosortase A [Cyanothece sp. UBA12306]